MKSSLFENSIRVPLIVSCPDRIPAGTAAGENVSLIDLTATLCDWAGADRSGLTGRSFQCLLEGATGSWDDRVLVEFYATWTDRPLAAYRKGDFKLMYSRNEPPQLFNLREDPAESRDLAANGGHAGLLREMTGELLERWPCDLLHEKVLSSQRERLKSRA
jgi:choline-sulfatase